MNFGAFAYFNDLAIMYSSMVLLVTIGAFVI